MNEYLIGGAGLILLIFVFQRVIRLRRNANRIAPRMHREVLFLTIALLIVCGLGYVTASWRASNSSSDILLVAALDGIAFALALGPELGYQYALRNVSTSTKLRPTASMFFPVIRRGIWFLPSVIWLSVATMIVGLLWLSSPWFVPVVRWGVKLLIYAMWIVGALMIAGFLVAILRSRLTIRSGPHGTAVTLDISPPASAEMSATEKVDDVYETKLSSKMPRE